MKTLNLKSYIEQYQIKKLIATNNEKNIYLAEDFKLDKEVFICECDISYRDIYEKVLGYINPNILRVDSILEENEKIYVISGVAKGTKFSEYLISSTKKFTENEINIIANSLIEFMIELKSKGLSVELNVENLLLYQDKVIFHDLSNITKYKTDEEMIFNLGRFMYMLRDKSIYNDGDTLKASSNFSVAQTALINRMLSKEKQFKSLDEIEVLIKGSLRKSEDSCEPIVCNEKRNGITSFIFSALAVILLSISTIYVYNSKKVKDVKDVDILNSFQFHIASYMGDVEAKYNLAKMYENGYVVDKDINKAMYYYKQAAKKGNLNAQLHLGNIYKKGSIFSQDIDEALKWYKLAAQQNSAYAQYSIGQIYYDEKYAIKDFKKAIYWFEKAAKQKYKYAYDMLGYLYLSADKENQDYKKAFKWFTLALEVNKPYAQISLAYMYERGYGVKKDLKKALELYRESALEGEARAQTNLAYMYSYGIGTSKDIQKAKYWYLKAAKQGDKYAIKELKKLND